MATSIRLPALAIGCLGLVCPGQSQTEAHDENAEPPAEVAPATPSTTPPAGTPGKTGSLPHSDKDAPDPSWVPPEDKFDWIQLKSGEWLKGRIKGMQNGELDFDSEELDMLTFDWRDIRQIRSAQRLDLLLDSNPEASKSGGSRQKTVIFPFRKLAESSEELSGLVTVTPEEVRVDDGAVHIIMPREQLRSLTPGGAKEWDYWSGDASIGLTLREGNIEQVEYNALLHLERRTPASRVSLDYIGYVSSTDGVESANNNRVNSEVDLWIAKRVYLILPSFEYYNDPFQNLDYRVTLGAGFGYDIIDSSDLEWNISGGPAYQRARFASSQPGEPTSSESAAVNFSSHFDWDINKRLELTLDYRGQYTRKEIGDTTHHFNGTFSVEVTKSIDLDVTFVWDRISNPQTGEDGVQPEPDDYRLILGFGMDF